MVNMLCTISKILCKQVKLLKLVMDKPKRTHHKLIAKKNN